MNIVKFREEHFKSLERWEKPSSANDRWCANYYHEHKEKRGKIKNLQNKFASVFQLEPEKASHKRFLCDLLFKENNGIASIGDDKITLNEFDNIIKDENAIKAIEEIFKNPNGDTGSMLRTALSKHINGNSHFAADYCCEIIANRVVVSCTDKVSAVVGPDHFGQVSQYLVEIVGVDSERWKWYDGNLNLMNKLIPFFTQELESGKTDIAYLRVFIWHIWWENFSRKVKPHCI